MKESIIARLISGSAALGLIALGQVCVAQQPFPGVPPAPRIRINSPANLSTFYAPVDIPIFATVDRLVGVDTNTEVYAGTNLLGKMVNLGPSVTRPPGAVPMIAYRSYAGLANSYGFVWTNPAVGTYNLTVVGTGPDGFFTQTSAVVTITILPSSSGTSNGTNTVNIFATDPIAVSGSNLWFWPGITNVTPAWPIWPPVRWGYTTNWGPKAALFTVRRFGDVSSPLTVNYSVGGTASNGVGYAELPGFITIPAGNAYGLIPVMPMDNNAVTIPKTVVLTLTADTNSPPDYLVGVPSRAAALIVHSWRRPLPWFLPDGSFHLNATGPDGAWFIVETSSDLMNWTPVCTNQILQGSIDFVDPNPPGSPQHYYQAVPLDSPPAQ